jgi:cobalamin biosynthesis protein CobT
MAPPAAAKKMVDLWRDFLEDKISDRLDQLDRFADDQPSSAMPCMTCCRRWRWPTMAQCRAG